MHHDTVMVGRGRTPFAPTGAGVKPGRGGSRRSVGPGSGRGATRRTYAILGGKLLVCSLTYRFVMPCSHLRHSLAARAGGAEGRACEAVAASPKSCAARRRVAYPPHAAGCAVISLDEWCLDSDSELSSRPTASGGCRWDRWTAAPLAPLSVWPLQLLHGHISAGTAFFCRLWHPGWDADAC